VSKLTTKRMALPSTQPTPWDTRNTPGTSAIGTSVMFGGQTAGSNTAEWLVEWLMPIGDAGRHTPRNLPRISMQSMKHEYSQNIQHRLIAESLATHVRDEGLYRTAARYARLPPDSFLVRELVADVIEDMLMGNTPCTPDRSLAVQLADEVRRRANRLRRDALRASFIPLEQAPSGALVTATEQHGTKDDGNGVSDAAEVVARIREYARADEAVQRLLGLYERGLTLRRQVLAGGMTEWAYRTARERLAAYATMAVRCGGVARDNSAEDCEAAGGAFSSEAWRAG
jgi:hypothetical protein